MDYYIQIFSLWMIFSAIATTTAQGLNDSRETTTPLGGNPSKERTNYDVTSIGSGEEYTGIFSAKIEQPNEYENQHNEYDDWFPLINVTCVEGELRLDADNPECANREMKQRKQKCGDEFKVGYGFPKGCKTILRVVPCIASQVCGQWGEWSSWEFKDEKVLGERTRKRECRHDIAMECRQASEHRKWGSIRGALDGDETPKTGPLGGTVKVIAFSLAGTVMVGLLVFAVLRLKKSGFSRHRRRQQQRREYEMQGIDNELGRLPSDSRINTILNTINSNGRYYEVRERADSLPGRRVYVLSPTPDNSHVTAGRTRSLNRMMSQLSSIAEEETEDALSHITETTEPQQEDDCVFRYDSDAINDLKSPSNQSREPSSENEKNNDSEEAINCINDVLAMYDMDTDEATKRQSNATMPDYRTSAHNDNEQYLQNYGWKPEERSWKIEKLKDEGDTAITNSCSTLNSVISEKSAETSSLNDVRQSGEPLLLGNDDGRAGSLKDSLIFKSLPSVLDTSQIPDIDDVLDDSDRMMSCDVGEDVINEDRA